MPAKKKAKPAPKPKPAKAVKLKPQKPSNGSMALPDALVELAAAKSDVRWYLNWPYLDMTDRKKPAMVATNGHVMAMAPVAVTGSVQAGPLPFEAIVAARKAAKKTGKTAKLTFAGDLVGTSDQMFKRPKHDFTYPDWRKIVNDADVNGREHDVALNGDYMAMMQKVIGSGNYKSVRIFCGRDGAKIAANKPVVFKGSTHSEAIGIVMPMRF